MRPCRLHNLLDSTAAPPRPKDGTLRASLSGTCSTLPRSTLPAPPACPTCYTSHTVLLFCGHQLTCHGRSMRGINSAFSSTQQHGQD